MGFKHPLRILVAEDNKINQIVLLRMLERLGYRADIVSDGQEVLAALEQRPYDVVLLMDIQMPNLDGVAATQLIHERWPEAEQPTIVAMTAYALKGDRERYLALGMDEYISKPIAVKELMAALYDLPAAGPLISACQPIMAALNFAYARFSSNFPVVIAVFCCGCHPVFCVSSRYTSCFWNGRCPLPWPRFVRLHLRQRHRLCLH
ncbi:MAG: response regulator [Ardenticatenaceae bacterium]|nr:response regulator [Ardenticatenaceae bacterium]